MKCKNCGQKITRKDSYCRECGEWIEQEECRKRLRKKVIKFGVLFILFLFVIFSGISITVYFHSPKYIAFQYFDAIVDSDVDKIYSYIEDKESLFVSESLLKEKDNFEKNIEDVKVVHIYEKGNKTYVAFSYMLNGKNTISYVELKKKKIFNILDTYKVVSGKVASNIEFIVPKDSRVTIDGKDITSYLQMDKTSKYDTYYIKDMIKGNYTIAVTFSNGLKIEKELAVEDGKTYKIMDVELTDMQKKEIEDLSIASLKMLSEAALARKDYDTIASHFKQNIESFYKQVKRKIQADGITALKYSDCEIKDAYINKDGNVEVSLLVDYTYTYKNTLEEAKTKEASGIISLTYMYDNETFILLNE